MIAIALGTLVARIIEDSSPQALAYHLAAALDLPVGLVDDLADIHQRQWALEDRSRCRETAPEELAQVKREIDISNGLRHRAINALDDHVAVTGAGDGQRFYSETVGELVDRLLILQLKVAASSGTARERHLALADHLAVTVAQLVVDIEAKRAALPHRVGIKIYGGIAQ
jgi:hypothetical protein